MTKAHPEAFALSDRTAAGVMAVVCLAGIGVRVFGRWRQNGGDADKTPIMQPHECDAPHALLKMHARNATTLDCSWCPPPMPNYGKAFGTQGAGRLGWYCAPAILLACSAQDTAEVRRTSSAASRGT